MNGFEVELKVEPTDKYEKARKAVVDAANAIGDLNPAQREQLAKELFGANAVIAMYAFMEQFFGENQ